MIIDALTITGLISAASFALMPLLMGRELLRVEECGDQQATIAQPRPAKAADRGPFGPDCVDPA